MVLAVVNSRILEMNLAQAVSLLMISRRERIAELIRFPFAGLAVKVKPRNNSVRL